MDAQFFIKNLWRRSCGLPEIEEPKLPELEVLRESEWNPEFEQLMRNRLVMGAIRYGRIGESNKPTYDRVSSAIARLEKYRTTGNTEFLVDVANLCLLEYAEGEHPKKHFRAIDDGEHAKVK